MILSSRLYWTWYFSLSRICPECRYCGGDRMAASMIGLGVGFLLGLRFKVFVLVPVTLAAVMLWPIAGLNWSNAAWMLLTAAAIQAGYLLGVVTCELMPKFSHLDLRWILRWLRNTGLDDPTT